MSTAVTDANRLKGVCFLIGLRRVLQSIFHTIFFTVPNIKYEPQNSILFLSEVKALHNLKNIWVK